MPRTSQFPSMTDQLLRQRQEIDALRRGLSEAIFEIEDQRRKVSGDQRDKLKVAVEAASAQATLMPIQRQAAGSQGPGFLSYSGGFQGDMVVAVPVPLWEDLLVAIDYLPDTME